MRFTVVMASTLMPYAGAASRRDEKIVRAIDSVIAQTFEDWELQVVADGCQKTVDIVSKYTDPRIHVTLLPKSPQWDGKPRNTGIELGKGDYIVYLDNDDYYGPQHLEIIDAGLNGYDWVCYNDWVFNGDWVQRHCDIKKLGANGTSNICHRRTLGVKWGYRGYAHDHHFNQSLLKFKNYAKIDAAQYFVMHLPHGTDL